MSPALVVLPQSDPDAAASRWMPEHIRRASAATPTTFRRLYVDSIGPEHPANPTVVATVLRSMAEHAAGPDPFRVQLRMDDGSLVTVSPKRQGRR